VSLQRIKIAFNAARRRGPVEWDSLLAALIDEAGGTTLHTYVPSVVREDSAFQLDLFESARELGMTIREIAQSSGVGKSTVHRVLSHARTGRGTSA